MKREFLEELENDLKRAVQTNMETDEAERLAAKFLLARLEVGKLLRDQDLDARLAKQALKTEKAVAYLGEVKKNEKKPSDTMLEQLVNTDEGVAGAQKSFDEAEVNRDRLQDYYSTFHEGHIFFRGIAKGRFE